MAEKLSLEDASMIYGDSLFIRKGRLVKVRDVHYDANAQLAVTVFDLRSRKTEVVLFVQDEFKTPAKRIGYVNCQKNSFYVVRQPVRVYKGGISQSNVDIRRPEVPYNDNTGRALSQMRELECKSILAAYNNEYPPLERAIELAVEFGSSCAFDKQFAVDLNGRLYYKTGVVGKVFNGVLEFNSDKTYLKTLLGGNHEKAVHTFGPTPL